MRPTLTAAGPQLRADPHRTVLLYKCWSDVFSGPPEYPAQEIGDCVSFSHAHALDLMQTIDVYLEGRDIGCVHRTCSEWIYGTARQIANMLGPLDGCYNSAAARAMCEVGVLSYSHIGDDYSGLRAKSWGMHGPPAEYRTIAAASRLATAVRVKTESEPGMMAAIQAGYPVTISTQHGFLPVRDDFGFCRMAGRWGHSMFVAGYRAEDTGRAGYCVMQSWGAHQPSGPTNLDQPSYSFWVAREAMRAIIAEGDCFGLAGSPVLEPRAMPTDLGRT